MENNIKQYLSLYPWLVSDAKPFSEKEESFYSVLSNEHVKELEDMYIKDCKDFYMEYKDKLEPLSMYENMEKVKDPKKWHWLFNRAKNEGVKFEHSKYDLKAKVKEIEKVNIPVPTIPINMYTNDELVALMKNFYVYATVNYFIYLRRYDDFTKQLGYISLFNKKIHKYVIDESGKRKYCNDDLTIHLMALGMEYRTSRIKVENKLEELNEDVDAIINNKDLLFEQYHYMAVGLCYDVQNYFLNGGPEHEKHYKETGKAESNLISIKYMPLVYGGEEYENYFKDIENGDIPNMIEEMHINDDVDNEYGRGTMKDIFCFVWDTLQYLTLEQLKDLIKLADNKFEFAEKKPRGRQLENKHIGKYDKLNNLIEIYENRNAAIKANKINPAIMSQILAGKKLSYGGYKYKFISISTEE